MSARNTASSNLESEAEVPFDPNQISQRIHGSSTPRPDKIYQPFVPPSDISSVTSNSNGSNSTTPRKRGRSKRSESETVTEERSSTSTSSQRVTLRSRSASNSTPVRQRNLESIVSGRLTSPSVRKSLSTAFSKLNVSNMQSDGSSCSAGNVEPPAKKHKLTVTYKGKEWIAFKPKHKDRIYADILDQPDNTLNAAKLWVQLYEKQAPQAIITLMQFFADVCGYQDLDVSTILDYETENYSELGNFMADHPPKYQKQTGKYLLKCCTNWSKQSHNAIYAFIRNLLEIANSTEILFDRLMLRHLLGIVMILTCSCNRSLHHTGVVIVAKINTVFLEIHMHIKKKIERYRSSRAKMERMEEQLNVLEMYETLLSEVLDKLQKIIEQHCCIQDHLLDIMEVTVIEEMFNWFELNPSLLSSTKYIRRLFTLVEDQSKRVRKAALVLCHKLISDNRMVTYVNLFIEKLVKVVLGRVYDIDYGIAASAVTICKDMLCKYSNAIPVLSRDMMVMLVYCKNQQLAMAAGAFLIEIFRKCDEDGEQNSATLIRQLITFSYLEEENYVPLLVEAVLPYCPELRDWNTMIDLLKGDLDWKDETKLIDIMSHAAQQTVTGKSKINRATSSQIKLNIQNVRKTTNTFIEKMYPLLKKFFSDPRSVRMLSEILLVIDYKDSSISKYITELTNIAKVLQAIFVKNTNEELLETISMVLAKFCEELSPFKNIAAGLVHVLQEAIVESFRESLENVYKTNNLSKDDLSKIESRTIKLLALFVNHDFTESVENELFNWLTMEDIVTAESMKNILKIGYWYVVWMLRKIIAKGLKTQPINNLQQSINQLKSTCDEYLKVCFNLLQRLDKFLICSEAFECICNIHVVFRQDLQNPIKSNPLLKELLPNAPKDNLLTLLMAFAKEFLFEDKNKSKLKSRRIALGNVMNLAFLKVISYQELSKVYKYYYSHTDDYGDIFTNGLKNIREASAITFVGVVLHTLVYCFTDTDITKIEARNNLRILAQQFQKFVARNADDVKLILTMGIKFAVFLENRYTFLYYLKYFIATLSANDRKIILEFFTLNISRLNRELEVFTDFIGYLKNGQKAVEQRTPTNDASEEEDTENEIEEDASSVVENYPIDDVSDVVQ